MTDRHFSKSVVEEAALAWFESLGYQVQFDLAIAPGEPDAERITAEASV